MTEQYHNELVVLGQLLLSPQRQQLSPINDTTEQQSTITSSTTNNTKIHSMDHQSYFPNLQQTKQQSTFTIVGSNNKSQQQCLQLQQNSTETILPHDIWLHIYEYIGCNTNIDLIAVSETCTILNYICHLYFLYRWDQSSYKKESHYITQPNHYNSNTVHQDGIVQRITYQDPITAIHLYQQYIQVEDDDNDELLHDRRNKYRTSIYHFDYCFDITSVISRTLEQQRIVVHDLLHRQLLSDHGLNAIRLQRQLAILLYTRTGMGIVLVVVVLFGLFSMNKDINDMNNIPIDMFHETLPSTIHDTDGMTVVVMRFIVALLFAITVAYGITKHNKCSAENKNQDQSTMNQTGSASTTSKSTSILRRSSSQPNLTQTKKASLRKRKVTMKRSQTIASSLESLESTDVNQQSKHAIAFNEFQSHTKEDNNLHSDELLYSTGDDYSYYCEPKIATDMNKSEADSPIQSTHNIHQTKEVNSSTHMSIHRLKPRGWVGLYHRAIVLAKKRIVHMIQEQRMSAYKALNMIERNELSSAFINACSNDTLLLLVKTLSQSIPTQDFYIGADGTESCALHSAAFHGSSQIIDFLCHGIDTKYYESLPCTNQITSRSQQQQQQLFSYNDGGLCDANVTDMNGWTALHYAAGVNSVEAVRVLVQYGASLDIPAVNGYTPLQWALRLQHHAVANELRTIMTINHHEHQKQYWRQLCQQIKKSLPSIFILSCFVIPNLVQLHR